MVVGQNQEEGSWCLRMSWQKRSSHDSEVRGQCGMWVPGFAYCGRALHFDLGWGVLLAFRGVHDPVVSREEKLQMYLSLQW